MSDISDLWKNLPYATVWNIRSSESTRQCQAYSTRREYTTLAINGNDIAEKVFVTSNINCSSLR